eukprot:CAMPEP_0197055522 /NCGR_PEP_ID=MMETSP1384-20130603/67272_1 /TAXON_ID=29189 /ORGANISM="Ammonia sp." /LENGTH=153 /DNA_ID=CAMNT_0042489133 /DNA_START=85 /DNA_END=543 /DNA_ORIENTATION=-
MLRVSIVAAVLCVVFGKDHILQKRESAERLMEREKEIMMKADNSTVLKSTCGGNCPSDDCSSCPCGTSVVKEDIATWCSKYSWNQKNCQCIMTHESGGNEHAANENSNGSFDVGLWQINTVNWDSCSGGSPPCDAAANLQCAIDVYKWGGNTW